MSFLRTKSNCLLVSQHFDHFESNLELLLAEALKCSDESLIIWLIDSKLSLNLASSSSTNPLNSDVQRRLGSLINKLYTLAFRLDPHIDINCLVGKVTRPVTHYSYNIIFKDCSQSCCESIHHLCQELLPNLKLTDSFVILPHVAFQSNEKDGVEDKPQTKSSLSHKSYAKSLVMGVFDRLHVGHKLLLTEASRLTSNKLLLGVIDKNELKNKILYELIEDWSIRALKVQRFINMVAPWLEVTVIAIQEPFEFAIQEEYECIIVSQEAYSTGDYCSLNERRQENNLPTVEVHVVEVVQDTRKSDSIERISSTKLRTNLLGTLITPTSQIPFDPARSQPFLVGITGGLASGKSTIKRHLESLGIPTVDCDKLGHATYIKGTNSYHRIKETFGEGILDEQENIDRKKLGRVVFNNPSELKKLTDIVWPEVSNLAIKETKAFFEQGHKIIAVEAALMIESKSYVNYNEIWITYLPTDEAIQRAIKRDNIDADKARSIISSQMKSEDRLKFANVVFSSNCDREEFIGQVDKAYNELLKRTLKRP